MRWGLGGSESQTFPVKSWGRGRPRRRQGRAPLTWRWLITWEFPPYILGGNSSSALRELRRRSRAGEATDPEGKTGGGRAPRATQDPPAPKTFGCEMCNLPGVSCAGRERRGPGKERRGRGGHSRLKSPPYLEGKGSRPFPWARTAGRRRGSPIPRPRTPNPGSPGLRTSPRTPSLEPWSPSLPPSNPDAPTVPASSPPEPRAPHSPVPASPALEPGRPQGRGPAHPVGALGEPVHLLRPPRHGCSRRAGERGRTRPGLVAARPWAAVERRGAAEGPSSVGCLHSRRPGSASRATRRPKRQNLKRYLRGRRRGTEETRSARLGRAGRAGPAAPPEAGRVGGAAARRGGRAGGAAPPEAAWAAGRRRAEPWWAGQ